jgi:hypothetical protein
MQVGISPVLGSVSDLASSDDNVVIRLTQQAAIGETRSPRTLSPHVTRRSKARWPHSIATLLWPIDVAIFQAWREGLAVAAGNTSCGSISSMRFQAPDRNRGG